ncbi:MAG TPA: TetR/AcrR family transcriptional regulator [Casimicrobiaceae bacterium]|nr:TetR/AcrR family transcriptional regulator [Casimicrobiaceae bacterium]
MAERKRPRRTRERILETSLALFNRHGVPHVTTGDIADELNISPGNLYYHFGNKDEIVNELAAAFEARLAPLFADPRGRRISVDDLWLWLHLLFEQMWAYRFLYHDLDLLTARDRALGARFAALLRKGAVTVVQWCRAMIDDGMMRATNEEVDALAHNAMLVAAYWPSYDRVRHAERDEPQAPDAGRAAYQVMALFGPYLAPQARAHLDRLAAGYL